MFQEGKPVELYNKETIQVNVKSEDGMFLNYYTSKVKPKNCIGFEKYECQVFDSLLKTNGATLVTGQRGVGKTALVMHIQNQIKTKNCSSKFYGIDFYKLDLCHLTNGIRTLSDYEDRLCNVFNDMLKNGKAIAYIDNLYQFVIDNHVNSSTSLYLETYIKKGLSIIACCSSDDLKHLDQKYPLMRYFTEIKMMEPSLEQTEEILMSNASDLYEKYRIKIEKKDVEKIVTLSDKYIKDSLFKMPKKAVNALEHIATHHINQFYGIDKKTKDKLDKLKKVEDEIDDILLSNTPDYGKLIELENQCDEINQSITVDKQIALTPSISDDSIYEVISNMAKVPVAKLTESDTEKLRTMQKKLSSIVIGQDETISKLCKTITRNRLGIRKKNHTIGNFMFVGPTGVGKTMLAKEVTKYMFGNYDAMVRLDMSEYIDEISVNKLIGAPPGYVGYGEGGTLCNAIKKNPYSVILFDEIEKAHPSVFNTLLQLLDEGHISDANGNKISAMNCIVIMTSNIGVKEANNSHLIGFNPSKEVEDTKKSENIKSIIDKAIKNNFAPEFINRLDSICYFNDLKRETINKIFDKELKEVQDELKKIGHNVVVKPSAKKYIVEKSEKEHMGARPLIRIIQQEIVDEVTDMIVNGISKETLSVTYDKKANKLKIE